MTRKLDYRWHLRKLMADKDMFATTDLQPLLETRGVKLSPAQVYRLVVHTPERLSLKTLAALCDILDCSPNDVIELVSEAETSKRRVAASASARDRKPRPARVTKKR
ncbi:MAG: helix-turn-helix domain-containing protein [Actinomycetota bacterium]